MSNYILLRLSQTLFGILTVLSFWFAYELAIHHDAVETSVILLIMIGGIFAFIFTQRSARIAKHLHPRQDVSSYSEFMLFIVKIEFVTFLLLIVSFLT